VATIAPTEVNIGQISKIVNFYPIDLKFEEDLHFRSLNSTSNSFSGQSVNIDLISKTEMGLKIIHHDISKCCE